MPESGKQELLVIDESMFYQLLDGAGTVHVDISCIEDHFVPFVSFSVDEESMRLPCGAIVRDDQDVLSAETMDELIDMLQDMAGDSKALRINLSEEPEHLFGYSRTLH